MKVTYIFIRLCRPSGKWREQENMGMNPRPSQPASKQAAVQREPEGWLEASTHDKFIFDGRTEVKPKKLSNSSWCERKGFATHLLSVCLGMDCSREYTDIRLWNFNNYIVVLSSVEQNVEDRRLVL